MRSAKQEDREGKRSGEGGMPFDCMVRKGFPKDMQRDLKG